MATSFKRSHACTTTLSAPNPAAGCHQPLPLLETPEHSQARLGQSLVGSLLSLGSWCTQSSVCPPQESVSQSCVSSGSSVMWLMETSSKKAYAIPKISNYSQISNYSNLPFGTQGFPGGLDSKESACNVVDLGSILGLGRSPGERNGNPLQYSCLGNHMDSAA